MIRRTASALVAATAAVAVSCGNAPTGSSSGGTPNARCAKPVTLRCAAESVGVRIGDGYDDNESPSEHALRVQQFDAVTDDAFLWSITQPEPGKWDFRATDAEIAFARSHHLYVTADHFIWDQIGVKSTPAWVDAINNPATLKAAMLTQISTLTHRYGDSIRQWTVVNEPFSYFGNTAAQQPNHFSAILGPEWIADSFRIAHEGAPHASLWLNEAFTETDPLKAHALVALARHLIAEHVPINGVSLEGHLFQPVLTPVNPDLGLVRWTLQDLAALGLKVEISEIDDPTLPATPDRFGVQSRNIFGLVGACLAVKSCVAISFWDIDDARSWYATYFGRPELDATLFTAGLQPKPAEKAVIAALLAGHRH